MNCILKTRLALYTIDKLWSVVTWYCQWRMRRMAFRVPNFNLTCNVWHAQLLPPVGPPDIAALPCQLAADHIIEQPIGVIANTVIHGMFIRVAARTDLRGRSSTTGPDTIECPAGTGRYYSAAVVDDVARGFPNEYRSAFVTQYQFPTPIP
jgi:hypothetical protein